MEGKGSFHTSFLDPRQLELAESALRNNAFFSYTVYGGYEKAERNVMNIFPAQHQGDLPPVEAVMVSWSGKEELSHRDLLGAVMSLGLRRDQVGDIILSGDNQAAVIVSDSKGSYICSNLTRAGHVALDCRVITPDELPLSGDEGREIKGTVASLRIDSVISLGFGVSRSRVVLLIKGGLVRVNWRPVSSPSFQLNEGDQVSLRGRGRLVVDTVEGETRKGRIRLKLKKYS
jgi:RNA-binding protein YlmH